MRHDQSPAGQGLREVWRKVSSAEVIERPLRPERPFWATCARSAHGTQAAYRSECTQASGIMRDRVEEKPK